MRSAMLRWILRAIPFVLVLSFSLAAFQSGVGLSERPGLPQAQWYTQLYYATGLFVLGGLDLGIPIGGPLWLRVILWVCFFVAPLATTTVLAEGLIRLVRPDWWVRSRRRDHVIVVGMGRFGTLLVEAIQREMPRKRILVVERDRRRATSVMARAHSGIEVLIGDIAHRSTLEELCLDRAHSVALMTENDLVNLEAAWDLIEMNPDLPAVIHVSNIGTLRKVENLETAGAFHFFNSHRFAAQFLFEKVLMETFSTTSGLDVVVIGGFGRFGQTIVERLQRSGGGELRKILLIDQDAERKAEVFADEVGFGSEIEWETIGADLSDPRTWKSVDRAIEAYPGVVSFVLGTDDDALNLRLAMAIRQRHPHATITLRCFHMSRFNQNLAESLDLTLVSIEGLVRDAVEAHLLPHMGLVSG